MWWRRWRYCTWSSTSCPRFLRSLCRSPSLSPVHQNDQNLQKKKSNALKNSNLIESIHIYINRFAHLIPNDLNIALGFGKYYEIAVGDRQGRERKQKWKDITFFFLSSMKKLKLYRDIILFFQSSNLLLPHPIYLLKPPHPNSLGKNSIILKQNKKRS